MRLSDSMNFPHPVLAAWRDDFVEGKFEVEVIFREDKNDLKLELSFKGILDSKEIEELVSRGDAMIGCFVVCKETGLRRLIEFDGLPCNKLFEPGELLGRVVITPVVWLVNELSNWMPQGVHEEFNAPMDVRAGDIIAMDHEITIHVGHDTLPELETIFEIVQAEGIPDGNFQLDLSRERVTIMASPTTKHLVDLLRETTQPAAVAVMNSLYVPVVMTMLALLDDDAITEYDSKRWFSPFMRRCEKLGITPSRETALTDAQRLFELPFNDLKQLTEG